jgi:dolichol-phosphate mannosyltransferase
MPAVNSQFVNRKVAVILPITSEAMATPRLINEIKIVLNSLRVPFTLVIVRNGTVNSHLAEYLDAVCYSEPTIQCISLGCPTTKQLAIRAGYESIEADAYITIDADGSNDARAIAPMLQKWLKGVDCVLAVRREDEEDSRSRTWSKRIYRMVGRRVCVPLVYGAENYCLLDKRVVQTLRGLPADERSISQQTSRLGFQRAIVGMEATWKRSESRIVRAKNHFRQLREGLLSHSRMPVHTLYWCATSAIALSCTAGIFASVAMLYNASTTFVLSVMMSACLGMICSLSIGMVVIGEYLYRLLQNGPASQSFALASSAETCAINNSTRRFPEQEAQILDDVNTIRASLNQKNTNIQPMSKQL